MAEVGLPRGTVVLLPYDSGWPAVFAAEKRALLSAFSADDPSIEHVGSTAVPGLPAKPIVDICLAIDDLSSYQYLVPKLEAVGYVFMPDRVFSEEVFMPKGPEENRRVYLHIVQRDSNEHRKLLLFRDRLREDPALRQAYAALKTELARQFPNDRKSYSLAKAEFIQSVLVS